MNERGNPQRLSLPLLIVLACLLVANLYLIVGVRDLVQAVDNLPKQYYQEIGSLRERVEGIARGVQAMEEEAAWYSNPRIEVEHSESGTPDVLLASWSFRELPRDADVGVHYRVQGEERWREATVRPEAPLSFLARMPLPEILEPMIEVHYSRVPGEGGSTTHTEAGVAGEGPVRLEYVISASDGKGHRSGGRESVDIGRWADVFLGSIAEVDRDRRFNVTLVDRMYGEKKGALSRLSSVYFVVRDRDGEVLREGLELMRGDEMWEGVIDFGERIEINALGFVVVTADGRETERIISVQ